mmetsp:Transcript_1423/g.5562  ORF Transcript_1423/g.5562 Transcript_1423/m.5562 type:complete len:221 (-) Transcript_1423:101-763(-)
MRNLIDRSHLPRLGELVRHEHDAARGTRANRPRRPPGEQRPRPALPRHRAQLGEDAPSPSRSARPVGNGARAARAVDGYTAREIFRRVADLHSRLDDVQRRGQRRGQRPRAHARYKVDAEHVAAGEGRFPRARFALARVTRPPAGSFVGSRVTSVGSRVPSSAVAPPRDAHPVRQVIAQRLHREPVRGRVRHVPRERRRHARPQPSDHPGSSGSVFPNSV